jgi:hypothetical protein
MYTNWIDPYWVPVRYRFYDTNTDFTGGASYDVTSAHISDQINNGYNYFHMACHGFYGIFDTESGPTFSSFTVTSLTNSNKYVNILTIACLTNAFDFDESFMGRPALSEAFIREPNAGAVSYIGASREGWGTGGSTTEHGASFKYDRMFYQFLFTGEPTSNPQQIGAV